MPFFPLMTRYPKRTLTVKPEPFVVTPQDYDTALSVIGTQIKVLAPNTKTDDYEIAQ
jgi:hypothetical protein